MANKAIYFCRVCGFQNVEPPWGYDGRTPLYDFCPCCGVEHGYQDSTPLGAQKYREQWIKQGAIWVDKKLRPHTWDLHEQLKNVPEEFK